MSNKQETTEQGHIAKIEHIEDGGEGSANQTIPPRGSFGEVLRVFIKLGVTSFGGPVAHLGYFRQEIVVRRKWLDEGAYADLIGLCQFLPGPSSSQMGIALGMTRAGVWGGLAAWLGFTLPSAILLTLFAYATTFLRGATQSSWLHGLLIVAVAVVAQAVPGPLFTFSAYLGAVSKPSPNGWLGALIALIAIFLPSFLFVMGILPFWNRLRAIEPFQAALRGINATVVGILLAALYQPIWTSAIHAPTDIALALLDFGLLVIWKVPPWMVVLISALLGAGLSFL